MAKIVLGCITYEASNQMNAYSCMYCAQTACSTSEIDVFSLGFGNTTILETSVDIYYTNEIQQVMYSVLRTNCPFTPK